MGGAMACPRPGGDRPSWQAGRWLVLARVEIAPPGKPGEDQPSPLPYTEDHRS
jgi:hypothetical protein